jgi:hypothetical protein
MILIFTYTTWLLGALAMYFCHFPGANHVLMYRDTSNSQYLQSYSQCGLAACADNSVSEKGFLSYNHTVGACHIVLSGQTLVIRTPR